MGEVIDLAAIRDRREGSTAPGRRRGRPYRYDPGPLEGKNTEPKTQPTPPDDDHKTPA